MAAGVAAAADGLWPVVPLLTDSRPHWRQQIATYVPDLSTADGVMHDILTAAGWVRTTDCDSSTPTEITCAWESSGYQLQTSVALSEKRLDPRPHHTSKPDAVASTEEAVTIYDRFAQQDPGAH